MKTEHVPIGSIRVDEANVRKHKRLRLKSAKKEVCELFGQEPETNLYLQPRDIFMLSRSGRPEMKIERVSVTSVRVDHCNVRNHNERNLATIKRSLETFGQQKPIVIGADGVVVAGNGTLDAARALSWTHIDVVRTELEGSARKAYAVADNRTAELAMWDESGLSDLLASLERDPLFDETATGFNEREIERLIAVPPSVDDQVLIDSSYQIVVQVDTEEEQQKLFERLTAEGCKCRVLTL